jgi:hypothetical protein
MTQKKWLLTGDLGYTGAHIVDKLTRKKAAKAKPQETKVILAKSSARNAAKEKKILGKAKKFTD